MSAPATLQPSPTPILDRLAPLPPKTQSNSWKTAAFLAGLAPGVLFAVLLLWRPSFIRPVRHWILATFAPAFAPEMSVWLLLRFFLAVYVACLTALLVHECGHALAGACAGFRFNSLGILRLEFHRGWRISWHRKATGASGWAAMSLVKQDYITLRAAALVLGGPLSNLLSLALLLLLPIPKGLFAATFAACSLAMGVINLVPMPSGAMIGDGARLLMLLRGRHQGERWVAIMTLLAELRQGVMPEELPSEWIARAIAVRNNSNDTVEAHSIAYIKAFYGPDPNNAAMLLETCLQYSGFAIPVMRETLISDAAVFQARKRNRTDLAEQWLADLPAKTEMPWERLRAEAAILQAQGDVAGARKKLDEVEKLVSASPNQAVREMSLRGLRRWIDELPA